MRILNDDKYSTILDAARQEFIDKGFKNASMRDIAQKADVGLSNIYNYFTNKNELFLAVVNPAKNKLMAFVTERHSETQVMLDHNRTYEYHDDDIDIYIDMLIQYKEEFRLLLFQSQGSSVENFRDAITDHMTAVSCEYMGWEKKHFPKSNNISPFFIHTMSSWMVSIIGEIVTHELDKKMIRDFFYEYFRFGYAGWREIVGIEN